MSTLARLCRSAVLPVVAASFALVMHAQQTLRVPQDFSTLQGAINAANSGDTVSVGPGTYFENLTLDTKEITLISTAGPATTTLDGSHLGPVLKITNTSSMATVVSGFTIQNGSPLGSSAGGTSVGPAGVLMANAGAQITQSSFQKNAGANVGVINGSLKLSASSVSTALTGGGSCALSPGATYSNPATGVYLSGLSTVLTGSGTPVPSVIIGTTLFGDGTRCSGLGVQAVNLGQPLTLQSNTIRNTSLGVAAQAPQLLLIQNLIYDNVMGGLSLKAASVPPNVEPLTTFLVNNTVVNNLTSPDPSATSPTDIFLDGTVARTALVNNILVGTTPHPVLTCATYTPSINDVPLVFDHNDLYNTTNAPDSTLSGDCLTAIGGSANSAPGNLSVDPRLAGSTDLHPLAGSPVIDAGNNSAPGLLFDAFSLASGTVTTQSPLLTDFAGNPRIADATNLGHQVVDMGAYEATGSLPLIPTASVVFTGGLTSQNLLSLGGYTIISGGVHPTGTITVLDGGIVYGPLTPGADGIAHGAIGTGGSGAYAFQAVANLSDPVYAPSTSMVIYTNPAYLPTPATTTLAIVATPGTQTLDQPVTLTVHLGSLTTASGATQPGPVPPGVLTLSEGNTILSSLQPDGNGLVTYTISHPTVGDHTYIVSYAGTSAYSEASASTSVTITAPVATTLTAVATPNLAPLHDPVACTAHVVAASGSSPTGTVLFTDGATSLGQLPLTLSEQGVVAVSVTSLSLGLHTITVLFQPDPGFSPSSGTCTVNVGGNATLTTLSSSKNPAITTDSVTYFATVTNSMTTATSVAPSGSVTLAEDNTLLATAPLVAGSGGSSSAALPVILSAPGVHILTATYVPATAATFTSAATVTELVTAAPVITTVVSATPNPATIGQSINLSAAVTSPAPLPTPAMITFLDGASVLGTVALPASGTAALAVNTLSLGAHQMSAILHTSDTIAVRSVSGFTTVQVNALSTTLALTASPAAGALATATVTLSAALTVPNLPIGTQISGNITFLDGQTSLGTILVDASGHATLSTAALAPGTHSLSAVYSGSDLLSSAIASAIPETISANATSTQLTAPGQTVAFAPVPLAAHVASATPLARINALLCSPACLPIVVTFFADTPAGRSTLGVVPVDGAGNANLTITPAVGTYTISAAFSGSPLFAASTSTASALIVTPAATALTLSANPNPVYQHGAVTLTAALTAPGIPASALSGTISFLEGSTVLGTATLAAAQSFAYTPVAVGTHVLTAVFSGGTSLLSSSASVTVTVLPSDFVLSVKDPTLTIATTHHAPTTITISATGSLADHIDLSCEGLPQNAHCTFAPATHDLTTTNSSSGTLTLDTDALLNYARVSPVSPEVGSNALTAVLAFCVPPSLLAGLVRLRRRGPRSRSRRYILPHLLATFLLSIAAITLSGCSGVLPPHVASGTYAITIRGHARSSGIEHTTAMTLVVTK